jgi:heat shock protein HslJ
MIRFSARHIVGLGAAIIVIALALPGCSPARDDAALLGGRVWQATEVRTTRGLTPTLNTAAPTSEFADGKVSGTTGVNRYNGQYKTESGDKISIQLGPMTLMAGPPEAMALEQAFVEAMKTATRYSVTETELSLQDDSGQVLVSYKLLKETPLVGTEWNCTMYNNGRQGFQGLIASSTITAVFGEDKSLTGNAGVNTYNGQYSASNGKITIDPAIATTRMAGPPDLMTQEQEYLAALPRATVYKIEGATLMLRDATGAAIASYEAK